MSTMLNAAPRMLSASASTRTWPTISPALRFLTSPILPVRQNAHAIAQPTCVEMQKVIDGGHAASVEPSEDLARMKARVPPVHERRFECRTFQLGEIGACDHAIMCILACNPFSLNRLQTPEPC